MARMKFHKMHGLGNDYVFVNALDTPIEDPAELAVTVSDRHTGVGSDGLILLTSSNDADFGMRMWNADGSVGEMCGNGIRCLGKLLWDLGLSTETELTIDTLAGPIGLTLLPENGSVHRVRVDMGEPRAVQLTLPEEARPEEPQMMMIPIVDVEGEEYELHCVSMGNPHAVIFVDDVNEAPVQEVGPTIEHLELFPGRTNVEFVHVLNRGELMQRTWERGSGETQACGTGACGVTVAAILTDRVDRTVVVHLLGGALEITWDEEDNHVYMTGPAETAFVGEFPG
jgi:diaminopimelate epimerase